MSAIGFQFILNNAPIFIGASLLLLMFKINPLAKKYVITNDSKIANPIPLESKNNNPPFQNYFKDQLIMNGTFLKDDTALQTIAFEELGIISIDNLNLIKNSAGKLPDRIILVSKDPYWDKLQNLPFSYSKSFGLLLPYILNSTIEVVAV